VDGHKSLQSKRAAARQSSAFASATRRFRPQRPEDGPDPGAYDTRVSWQTGNRATGTLGSGPKRFRQAKPAEGPGPGVYTLPPAFKPARPNRKGVMVSTADRFKEGRPKAEQTPGAGHYDSEYLYGNMVRKTYNVSIAEEMYG
jgi:hypothetical protein